MTVKMDVAPDLWNPGGAPSRWRILANWLVRAGQLDLMKRGSNRKIFA